MRRLNTATIDPVVAAKSAGLRYISDESLGITRERRGKSFRYRSLQSGQLIQDRRTLTRIKQLAIPPAWSDVWICPDPAGHIQATGRDARRRKQYRYHPDWRAVRDETKYERILAFAHALPAIRRRVASDLRKPGLGREKVLAAVVRLLETTLIRVGNEEYAKSNRSFGLCTMRNRHVSVRRGTLHFEFQGKSGKRHTIDLHDAHLAEIVSRTQDLPGQELFQYIDEAGFPQRISSEDVNAYLQEAAEDSFSAKDFRTWAGTVLAAVALREFEAFDTKAQAKKNLLSAIERVAGRLGNTPAVCRRCYIHPVIVDSYLDGKTVETLRANAERTLRRDTNRLSPAEAAVLAFLQQQLEARQKENGQQPLSHLLAQSLTGPVERKVRRRRARIRSRHGRRQGIDGHGYRPAKNRTVARKRRSWQKSDQAKGATATKG